MSASLIGREEHFPFHALEDTRVPYINLPPGNKQLRFPDDSVARRENGKAFVTDAQGAMINSMRGNGEGGLINGQPGVYGASGRPGRTCCGRLYYAFTKVCPKCGGETSPE